MAFLVAFDRTHKINASWSIFIFILTLFPSNYCGTYGHEWVSASAFASDAARGRHSRALLQTTSSSDPNCTKVYTTTASDICETLQSSQNLSQAQLLELNPRLNCKTLKQGLQVCVAGISSRCNTTITVNKGPTNQTCASVAAAAHVSTEGFFVLNPGIICPEKTGNSSWLSSGVLCTSPGFGMIFIEYIGASGIPIKFSDVQPLAQSFKHVVFHLALAFASDTAGNGTFQSGNFTPHWSSSLDPLSAQAFKADNPGVRFLVSIGGSLRSSGGNRSLVDVAWVDPPNNEAWIDGAQSSLTILANNYLLDGVDVHYQNIPNNSSSFAYCIGTLIQRLKANKTIGIATIAPYGGTLQQYLNLMYSFGGLFDYVAFQFNKYQLQTAQAYIDEFNNATFYFNPWKVLASTEILGNNSLTGRAFVSAMVQVAKLRGLPGVVVFEADDSLKDHFSDQTGVLTLLNDPSTLGNLPPAPAMAPAVPPITPRPSVSPSPSTTSPSPIAPVAPTGPTGRPPTPSSPPSGSNRMRATGGRLVIPLITGILLLWLPFHDALI